MAALDRGPEHLLRDRAYFGQLFESLVVHELRAFTGREVYHARLNTKREVDAIANVQGRDVLVEVKLGYSPEVIEQAADSLKRFAVQLEEEPALVVITSGVGLFDERTEWR